MTEIKIEQTASGGVLLEIKSGNSVKNLTLTPGELSELGPQLASLAEDATLKIKQKEIDDNDQIPDDDSPDQDPDDNDFLPDD